MNKTILEEAARRFGTPCYVISGDDFAHRANAVKEAFGENTGLCYSIKANPFLLKYLPDAFSYIEVCSPGELSICEELSVPMSKVIFSGVNKTERDVERAWNDGVGLFTAESLLHVRLINARAVKSGGKARLILRLSHGSQFGMDASVIKEVIRNRDSYKGLEIVGLHYFTGTQKRRSRPYAGSFHCWTNSARSWNRSWVSVQSTLSMVRGLRWSTSRISPRKPIWLCWQRRRKPSGSSPGNTR